MKRAQKTYRGRHRRIQIQEFSLKETCLWMHKSEQTRQGFISLPINTDLSILEETESSNQHLHTANTSQIPGDLEQKKQGENHLNSPGCLPEYNTIYKPSMINWGNEAMVTQLLCRPQS